MTIQGGILNRMEKLQKWKRSTRRTGGWGRPLAVLAAALCLTAGAWSAAGQEEEAKEEVKEAVPLRQFEITPMAGGVVKIDGVMDEAAWESAVVIDMPYEWFPGDNVTPPVKTDSLVMFDGDNLYVGFRAYDPDPSQVRAHLMDRDAIGLFVQDDHVGFTLDTFNDERRAFQFRVNPLGVQIDAIFSERLGGEDFSWDAIWDSAGRVTADGYVVEIAVPLKQLRFPRTTEVQTWGYESFRSYPRGVRTRISSRFKDRQKDCILCQENKIAGFRDLAVGRNLEIIPTLTGVSTDSIDSFPDGKLQSVDDNADLGASVRWGVTPNVTISATVNPDFSQVEADVAQLDINTRFALFFPEKRPFFLEGAELFQTPLDAVFTRTVADPRWGAKLSAKEGSNTLGVFVADDRINNILIPGNQGSRFAFLDESVTTSVAHYTREVGDFSALGVLYTGREGDDYHNRVGGLDGFLRFTPSDTVRVQYLKSDTLYPTAVSDRFGQPTDSFDGDAFALRYDHFAKLWKGYVSYEDLDPDFRADAGFIPRVDVKTSEVGFERFIYGEPGDWYAQMIFGGSALRTEDHSGLLTDEVIEVFGLYQGPKQSFIRVQLFDNQEFFAGTTYDLQKVRLFGQFSPSGNVRAALAIWGGDEVDFENGRPGDLFLISPNLLMRLGRHLTMEFDYVRQELDVEGGQLFSADLAQANIIYNFNVRSFARGIVQYQSVTRDPDLYLFTVDKKQDDLFLQLLYSYKINPQTVLFVGYTDSRFGFEDQISNISLTQTDRTFFLKLGYAFLF